MSSSTVITSADNTREPVVPWWHTVLVVLPIAVGSVASWHQHGLPNAIVPGISSRLSSYITVLVREWFVALLLAEPPSKVAGPVPSPAAEENPTTVDWPPRDSSGRVDHENITLRFR
jgi:hypothetical protein